MQRKTYITAVLLWCMAVFLCPLRVLALGVSETYEESLYYDRLCQVELTGNYRRDLVAVALSQVGYHEGDEKSDYAGTNHNGFHNFTEFSNAYFGMDGQWCAMFVSWCARQAKIPTSVINSACGAHINNSGGEYAFRMTVRTPGSYTPIAGDLVFFSPTGWGASHVGIVAQVTADGIYAVEGNAMDAVRVAYYPLDDAEIAYYGVYSWQEEKTAPALKLTKISLVCTEGENGFMPDGDPYRFDTLYALHGTTLTLPKGGFTRENHTLAGYYIQRSSNGTWYCGDVWSGEGTPVLLPDGADWYFDEAWASYGDLRLYCVWTNEVGELVPDSKLPLIREEDRRTALYQSFEPLFARMCTLTELTAGCGTGFFVDISENW